MRSVQENLKYAKAAVEAAVTVLWGKATNKPDDISNQLQQKYGQVIFQPECKDVRLDLEEKLVAAVNNQRDEWKTMGLDTAQGESFREVAKLIRTSGIGNCLENAILACVYLEEQGLDNVYLVETVGPPENARPGSVTELDHVWVMLGLEGQWEGERMVDLQYPNPSFGPHAVVCDPWQNAYYSVQSEWGARIGPSLRASARYLLNNQLPRRALLRFLKYT